MSYADQTHGHSDLSAPPVKYSFEWWEARNNAGRCKAHSSRTGQRCKRPHDPGTNVCGHHGARAPAVRRRARQRLEEASDRMARALLKMAVDPSVADAVKLRAITEALDRGNVTAKTEIELTAKPWESVFENLEGGSRAESRRARGIPDDTPSPAVPANDEPIEAEVVTDFDDVDSGDLYGASQPITPGDDERRSVFDTAPPNDGLMTMDESMAEIARLRREAVERTHREQRALPPGNSARR